MRQLKRKQVAFDVHPLLHKRIKVEAARRGISMNMLMCEAIYNELNKHEDQKKTATSSIEKSL